MADHLKSQLGVEELVFDRQYGKKKLDTDFSGFGGFMKLMEVMMGVEPSTRLEQQPEDRGRLRRRPDHAGESAASLRRGKHGRRGHDRKDPARSAKRTTRVKAIVLRVDSPADRRSPAT